MRALHRVRGLMGADVHLHGLGMGADRAVIAAVRESIGADDASLLNSLDTSTPEMSVRNNKLPDKTWNQHRAPLPEGDDSSMRS